MRETMDERPADWRRPALKPDAVREPLESGIGAVRIPYGIGLQVNDDRIALPDRTSG